MAFDTATFILLQKAREKSYYTKEDKTDDMKQNFYKKK
jgi:hypothetical protein